MSDESEVSGRMRRLRESGWKPNRSLGQNFLHDPSLLRSLVDAAGVGPSDAVFEVGTGAGTLTRELAQRARHVLTVEVDERLVRFVSRELSDLENVELLHADILEKKSRLSPEVVSRLEGFEDFLWVANLPYAVATPVILLFLEAGLDWRRAILTLQAEVCDRFCAEPGSTSYGSATLLCAFWARARRARKIGAGTFYPAPRVESSVLELEPAPVAEPEVYPQYRAWVRRLFQSPRKQLRKILRDALGPDRAQDALELGGWEPDQRPSSLRVAEILRLAARFSLDGH